jgi:hypothetical protein
MDGQMHATDRETYRAALSGAIRGRELMRAALVEVVQRP